MLRIDPKKCGRWFIDTAQGIGEFSIAPATVWLSLRMIIEQRPIPMTIAIERGADLDVHAIDPDNIAILWIFLITESDGLVLLTILFSVINLHLAERFFSQFAVVP
jgi:hypothetical protein